MPALNRRTRIAELKKLALNAPCFGVHAAAVEQIARLLHPRGVPQRRPTRTQNAALRTEAATLQTAAAAGRVKLDADVAHELATYTWSNTRAVALWLGTWAELHGTQADTERIQTILDQHNARSPRCRARIAALKARARRLSCELSDEAAARLADNPWGVSRRAIAQAIDRAICWAFLMETRIEAEWFDTPEMRPTEPREERRGRVAVTIKNDDEDWDDMMEWLWFAEIFQEEEESDPLARLCPRTCRGQCRTARRARRRRGTNPRRPIGQS